ncbi:MULTISPECIES: hypothetical protein [Methylobacterium]
MERRIKGWSRAKKEALMRSDRGELTHLSRRLGAQEKIPASDDDKSVS